MFTDMEKGKTNNPNGRPKGKPNKSTLETRQFLNELLAKNQKQIVKDLKMLEPKDRLNVIEKFMQYTTPKMASVSQTVDFKALTDEQLDEIIKKLTNGDD